MVDQTKHTEEELKEIHLKPQEALGKPKPLTVCACGEAVY